LAEVGEAAEAIAGGRLDTRLDTRDDPDLRPLTESFNHMVTALEDRIERDARFASEVSHELRSPLMTLTASIEVLDNSRSEMSERSQRALDLLHNDLDRFKQLVEDLLEISRFDAGAIHLDVEDLAVAEIVRQAVAVSAREVPVEVEPEAAQLLVRIDKRRMAQVIANLLDNASKYAGGAEVVKVEAAPGCARIAVEDGGPGVSSEERSLIFDRFSRGSAGGKRSDDFGTGLGLALIHEHVNLHRGRVWVEDRSDGKSGARFVVELPTVSAEERDAAPYELTGDLLESDVALMVVDDAGGGT
jgi:signal transduction histidine kinase